MSVFFGKHLLIGHVVLLMLKEEGDKLVAATFKEQNIEYSTNLREPAATIRGDGGMEDDRDRLTLILYVPEL